MPVDIDEWLKQFGLEKYAPAFVENEVGVADLAHLSDDDLRELGLPLGPRRRLQAALSDTDEDSLKPDLAAKTQLSREGPESSELENSASDAQRRQLTVMFVDLVGSTEIARKVDVEDLNHVNRAYQAAATEAIQRFGGNVAKYMGDGILAYFGYPVAHEDDPERSVRAGLDLIEAVQAVDLSSAVGSDVVLSVRVGIATGMVVVGDLIGEGVAQERSVVGETPNLAARIEAAAQPNTVAVAPSTYRLTDRLFDYASMGEHALKGFEEKVQLWHAVRAREVLSRFRATRARHLTPLVARDDEVALLMRRWQSVVAGEGHAVLLCGEPGIGKSRLATAFREEVRDSQYIWLSFQCSPHHTSSPFHPLIAQLNYASGLSRAVDSSERRSCVEKLLRRVPKTSDDDIAAILSLLGVEDELDRNLSAQARKSRLISALTRQFRGLSREAPVLCLFEDVHWADPSSLEVLDDLIAGVESTSALILITARPEFEPSWAGQPCTTLLTLGRMGVRDSRRLVEEAFHSLSLPPETIEGIAKRADGVPLFIEELTQSALEHTATEVGTTDSGSEKPRANTSIPESLLDSLMARLDRSPEAREVAQVASVIGRDFEFPLLQAVVGLSAEQTGRGIEQLVDGALIQLRGRLPDAECRFKHALMRDAAYGTLTRSNRQTLHERLARHLDDQASTSSILSQPEVVGYHYAEAGLHDEAIDRFAEASRLAAVQSAFEEAAEHLQKAISLSSKITNESDRIRKEFDLQTALGRVIAPLRGYGSPETEAAFLRAFELSRTLDSHEDKFRILIGLRYLNQISGRTLQALDFGERCLEIAEQSQDPILLSQAHVALGHTRCLQGEFAIADRHFEACAESYTTAQHAAHLSISGLDPGVFGAVTHALVHWFLGQTDEALTCINRADKLSAEIGHAQSREHALGIAAHCYLFGARHQEALQAISGALDLAVHYGFGMRIPMDRIVETVAKARLNETALPQPEVVAKLIDEFEATGARGFGTYYRLLNAAAIRDAGDAAAVIDKVERTFELGAKLGEHWWDAELNRLKGMAISEQTDGDLSDAIDCVQQAVDIAQSQDAVMLQLRALCSLIELKKACDVKSELRQLQLAFDRCQQDENWPDIAHAKSLLSEYEP